MAPKKVHRWHCTEYEALLTPFGAFLLVHWRRWCLEPMAVIFRERHALASGGCKPAEEASSAARLPQGAHASFFTTSRSCLG